MKLEAESKLFSLLLVIITSIHCQAQSTCPWDFPKGERCEKYENYIGPGGDCIFDALDLSDNSCGATAKTKCAVNGFDTSCIKSCQRFHRNCCCPASNPPPAASPNELTDASDSTRIKTESEDQPSSMLETETCPWIQFYKGSSCRAYSKIVGENCMFNANERGRRCGQVSKDRCEELGYEEGTECKRNCSRYHRRCCCTINLDILNTTPKPSHPLSPTRSPHTPTLQPTKLPTTELERANQLTLEWQESTCISPVYPVTKSEASSCCNALGCTSPFLVIGEPDHDSLPLTSNGRVLVQRSAGGKLLYDILLDDGRSTNEAFGTAVAISCDATSIVVGSPKKRDPDNTVTGAFIVYTRRRLEDSFQVQQTTFAPNQGTVLFGTAVAMSGSGLFLAVSAPEADFTATNSGAIYLYARVDVTRIFTEQTYRIDGKCQNHRLGQQLEIVETDTSLTVNAASNADCNGNDPFENVCIQVQCTCLFYSDNQCVGLQEFPNISC